MRREEGKSPASCAELQLPNPAGLEAEFSPLTVDGARGRHPLPLPINKHGAAGCCCCCWLAGWRASERVSESAASKRAAWRAASFPAGPAIQAGGGSRRALRLALFTPDACAEEGRRRAETARPGLAFVSRRGTALSLAFAVAAHSQQGLSRLASPRCLLLAAGRSPKYFPAPGSVARLPGNPG